VTEDEATMTGPTPMDHEPADRVSQPAERDSRLPECGH
jgi:hypothetical protein